MKTFSVFLLIFFSRLICTGQELYYKVLFEYNKYDIPDTALLQLVKLIHRHPIDRVLLEGHCDSIGSKEYNYILSDNRANEVKKLLVQNGIPVENIRKCIGYGKDRPVTSNSSEQQRQLNRRVHITFYLKDTGGRIVTLPEPKPAPKPASVPRSQPRVKETGKTSPVKTSSEEVAVITTVKTDTRKPANKPQKLTALDVPRKAIRKEDFRIELSKPGDQVMFENILFEPGRHILKPESKDELLLILDLLRSNPTLEIEVQGHVCCATVEPDGYDWDLGTHNLSLMRAKEIYMYLVRNGIDKSRLEYAGYGGSRKINQDESTEELRRVNRRVEIKILKR